MSSDLTPHATAVPVCKALTDAGRAAALHAGPHISMLGSSCTTCLQTANSFSQTQTRKIQTKRPTKTYQKNYLLLKLQSRKTI